MHARGLCREEIIIEENQKENEQEAGSGYRRYSSQGVQELFHKKGSTLLYPSHEGQGLFIEDSESALARRVLFCRNFAVREQEAS